MRCAASGRRTGRERGGVAQLFGPIRKEKHAPPQITGGRKISRGTRLLSHGSGARQTPKHFLIRQSLTPPARQVQYEEEGKRAHLTHRRKKETQKARHGQTGPPWYLDIISYTWPLFTTISILKLVGLGGKVDRTALVATTLLL